MNVILRLLGFPSVFVGFGEGVYRSQQVGPHQRLEDAVKIKRSAKAPCAICSPAQYFYWSVVSGVGLEGCAKILTEGLEIFDGHKLVCTR